MIRFTRNLFIAFSLILLTNNISLAQEGGLKWYTDINEAYTLSGKMKKPIFALFTGSDWCGWCKKLHSAVFSKPEFQAWAKKNVILLELDFPRKKQLPEALAKQNNELQGFFKVQGFPTVWIFNMNKDKTNKYSIAALGSLGYPRAEAGQEVTAFLSEANTILKKK